ncbi:MAG: hypothetical protein KGL69_08710, partial [Alphaproteobacteria bacterium]|nr:hypothetical protein [Alphaproteobacteria bacterium]
TVGDLDLVVAAPNGTAVGDALAAFEEVATVLAKGPTRTSVVLASGLQVDLRVVQPDSFGAALVYFTGSRSHTIALRERAKARGLKLNEYGVFRGDTRIAGRTEEDVYEALGLAFIPPELREDRGEIAAAAEGRLPRLIALSDIRGDLHVHTDASDGRESLDAMVLAARARGYGYVAITDHSAHAKVAHGLDVTRLSAQLDAIDRLNARLQGIAALKASEVDILKDGRLDLPDEALARLDLVVAAIHSDFGLSRGEQTRRLLRAMDHPRVSIIAHPTGRLLGAREGYAVDMDAVIAHARNRGCALEINAHPSRLDLNDIQARAAKSAGARLSIGSDAHTSLGLGHMRLGVDQARRAWIEPQNTLNTRSWPELKALIAR